MARREVGEINAGSMADIAFLLLIFFLVTTTMEVDAGIARIMPLKQENPPPIEDRPEVHKRDVLEIMANSQDQLLVEGNIIQIEKLEEVVRSFYLDNRNGADNNPDMPLYHRIDIPKIQKKLGDIKASITADPENILLPKELSKWEKKMKVCEAMPNKFYMEQGNSAIIQLKNQALTSYGLYIQIQNILKKVVNDLRIDYCLDIFDRDYLSLDDTEQDDANIIEILRVLVPERIIEAKIKK